MQTLSNSVSKMGLIILALLPLSAFAASLGELSQLVTYLLGEVSVLANVVSFMTGAAFVISSLIKFQEYRRSPQNMPVSRPITELIVGVILFCLPLVFSDTVHNALFK
jgi:Na+/serine symporter